MALTRGRVTSLGTDVPAGPGGDGARVGETGDLATTWSAVTGVLPAVHQCECSRDR